MAVTPLEMLTSARCISTTTGNEADFRSCISRNYYAGYHAAREFHDKLSKPGLTKANVGEHENLIHMLCHPNVPQNDIGYEASIEISQYLKKSLFNRRLADYDIKQNVQIKNVEIVQSQIDLIFETI